MKVDDGIHRNYTPFESFNDTLFPLVDVTANLISYTRMDPATSTASAYQAFIIIGVIAEILRWTSWLSYGGWRLDGKTQLSDYPIVGHVACNLLHAVFSNIPIIAVLSFIGASNGGLGAWSTVGMVASVFNCMRSFINMGKLQDYLNDTSRKEAQVARMEAEAAKRIHPVAEDDPAWDRKQKDKNSVLK